MIYWDNYHIYGEYAQDIYNEKEIELYSTNNLSEAKQAAREYYREGNGKYKTVYVVDRRKLQIIYSAPKQSQNDNKGGTMEELKQCPFCGHSARITPHSEIIEKGALYMLDKKEYFYAVGCTKCSATSKRKFTNRIDAVKWWNKRSDKQ